MAKNFKRCDNCGKAFPDTKLNSVTEQPSLFSKYLMDGKPEKKFYCDECIKII